MATRRYRLVVDGMTCDDCEQHVEAALAAAGADGVTVSFRRGRADFSAGAEFDPDAAARAIETAGYHPGRLEILDADQRCVRRVWSGGTSGAGLPGLPGPRDLTAGVGVGIVPTVAVPVLDAALLAALAMSHVPEEDSVCGLNFSGSTAAPLTRRRDAS